MVNPLSPLRLSSVMNSSRGSFRVNHCL